MASGWTWDERAPRRDRVRTAELWPNSLSSVANFPFCSCRPRIVFKTVKRVGPSVAKSKKLPLVERQLRPLVRCTDYRWRELFETADVISEGAVRDERGSMTYYGSTSILLNDRSHGGQFQDEERAALVQMLSTDPHARVRAVRMACLDAQVRAQQVIDSVRADFSAVEEPRGVRITIEVEARVIDDRSRRSSADNSGGRGKR